MDMTVCVCVSPPNKTFSHYITICKPPCVGLPHSDTANKSEHHFVYLLFRLSHSSPSSSLSALIQGFQQNGTLLCKLTQRAHQRGCWVHFGSRPALWCSSGSSSHSSQWEPAAQTAHNGYGILPAPQLAAAHVLRWQKDRGVCVAVHVWWSVIGKGRSQNYTVTVPQNCSGTYSLCRKTNFRLNLQHWQHWVSYSITISQKIKTCITKYIT